MTTSRTRELVGIALAGGAALAFGTLAIFAKYAYDAGATPVPLLALRFAVAALLLVIVARLARRHLPLRPQPRLLLLGIAYAFESSLFFAALQHAPAGVVSLIFYSFPIWTTLLGAIVGLEPLRRATLVALLLASAGVGLVFAVRTTELLGPLLALAAALAVTVYMLVAGLWARDVEPLLAGIWTSGGAALALAVVALATREALPLGAVTPSLGLGLVTAVAFAGLYAAIARIGSARSAVAMMLEPVTTIGLAALILGEELSGRVLVGAALVIAALPILASAKERAAPSAV